MRTQPQRFFLSIRPGDLVQQFTFAPIQGDLFVLDTDYKTYSVNYSCLGGIQYGWIMSRSPKPMSKQAVRMRRECTCCSLPNEELSIFFQKARAFSVLKANGINPSEFLPVQHHPYCQYDAKPTCRDEPFPRDLLQTVGTNYKQAATLLARFFTQAAGAARRGSD